MKRFFKRIFFLVFIIALSYLSYNSIYNIKQREIAAVFDSKYNKIIRFLDKGWFFIPEALWIDRIDLFKINKNGSKSFDVKVFLPEFDDFLDGLYAVKFSLKIDYSIEIKNLNFVKADFSNKYIEDYIKNRVSEIYLFNLRKFQGKYSEDKLKLFLVKIEENVFKNCTDELESVGIGITNINRVGSYYVPSEELYRKGILFKSELFDLKKQQMIELKEAEFLAAKKLVNDQEYYKKLEKISGIIKTNPDILKYIYIDKLGANVKMILPLNSSGYPLNFDEKSLNSQNLSNKKEIDNLR